ncbi:acetaldehyde dehydrogenase (acetylating) [Microbacterium sp. Ag1]|uniref:acetaldehyde dehydrogenase (acetylating) n=1 Tax=Microbacterium sp. Ag1 TaxID=1643443 RepID=UPI000629CA3C|nr:acetaldehyde dehydrogenase (acetylating) [Microbacterium sp. Ag1]KKX96611.1 acetaldehyde dehydrogenase [Microbacterium sp. Ag1]
MTRHQVAIIGSGNIGTDLLEKIRQLSDSLEVAVMVGIDPDSAGLARARGAGIATTSDGIDGLLAMPQFERLSLVFDATSAAAHARNSAAIEGRGITMIDLTPAAIGPYVIPSVNLDEHLEATNVNMVTCGGQATVPVVAAISSVTPVAYAEIVASISSASAGPGTRANIDEFTETTSAAITAVGRARAGKAIIVLNPADPPLLMRDTVFALVEHADEDAIRAAVETVVAEVAEYVPGFRLKQAVQFDLVEHEYVPALDSPFAGTKVSVFLEVEGAGHHLPPFAGNLDIMTSAAMRTAERIVAKRGVAA